MLRRRLEDAALSALATAERVQQRVMTEENKEKVRSMMEKIGNAVEELVDEGKGTTTVVHGVQVSSAPGTTSRHAF